MTNNPELEGESVARTTKSPSSWVAEVTGEAVERGEALAGGLSSRVERWWLADGRSIVTRTHTDADWLVREPDLIPNEARALELVAEGTVAGPRLIAADRASHRLAMTFVEGSMITDADRLGSLADTIADTAHQISLTPLPHDHGLPPWRSWAPSELAPPDWGDARLWGEAIDAYRAKPTPSPDRPVLLHRDLHPLNLLWRPEGSVAVVDWVNACVGHPHAELGHLRWNLTVLVGLEAADHMLDTYLRRPGSNGAPATYDAWWDLAPAMSFLPGPIGCSAWHDVGRTDLTPERVVEQTERFVADALARS